MNEDVFPEALPLSFIPLCLFHLLTHFISRLFSLAFTSLKMFLFFPTTFYCCCCCTFLIYFPFPLFCNHSFSSLQDILFYRTEFVFSLICCAQRVPRVKKDLKVQFTHVVAIGHLRWWPQLSHPCVKLPDLTAAFLDHCSLSEVMQAQSNLFTVNKPVTPGDTHVRSWESGT